MTSMRSQIYRRFMWPGVILVAILVIGTIGYRFIGGSQYSIIDDLYMTVITIATIGFSEIIDLSGNPAGRVFTMFIAVAGMGILVYIITNLTAFVVEGDLTESFRRRQMYRKVNSFQDHYIVCGLGSVGFHIVSELRDTKRLHVLVDVNRDNIEGILGSFSDEVFIEGDPAENNTLLKAGLAKAKGLFAVTGDDNENLVISLTAKQLNPNLRVVAQCNEIRNSEKIRKAGADAVVCPSSIGGLRMASEMMRPTAVSFLDVMLRDKERNLRVEEILLSNSFVGKTISALNLKRYSDALLLAIKTKEGWIYNPSEDRVITAESTLVFMMTPEARKSLEKFLT